MFYPRTVLLILALLLPLSMAHGRNFSGEFLWQEDDEQIHLTIREHPPGQISGTLVEDGIGYLFSGQRRGDEMVGSLEEDGERVPISARFRNGYLELHFIDEAETLLLIPTQGATAQQTPASPVQSPHSPQSGRTDALTINGTPLTSDQINEIQQTYGITPLPGNYWYDTNSGLYGMMGMPTAGFMLPGHTYGRLDRHASSGNTGVFINGRELPQLEWATWSELLGYMIQPAAYWLDSQGNTGMAGNPMPLDNLYQAAQRNAYRGGGGGGSTSGGDNSWSSRFSSGNYDSGNQRGYVSVPGHGPIGYGFD